MLGLLDDDDEPAPAAARVREREGSAVLLELSVILPARNEARNLRACLESLLRQSEPGFALGREWQIVVVDDGSTDATREIAAETLGLVGRDGAGGVSGKGSLSADHRELSLAAAGTETEIAATMLLGAPALAARGRLTGKNNACWAGAQQAQGRWLLFTDADTVFEAGSVSRSVREAERHEAALLSYSPRQVVEGVTQHLVMPLIFSELASVYPPAEVNDPARSLAAANGQFLLVERETYFAAGGHRALGGDVLEDVALARNVKRAGGRIRLRYAPEALATRMYWTTAEMVEGWTKNLAALMPAPVALGGWRTLDFVLLLGLPLLAMLIPHLIWWQRAAILLIALRTALRYYTRVARAHAGFVDTALSPLGLPLFVYLLLRSAWAYRVRRRVTWKGRSYDPNRT